MAFGMSNFKSFGVYQTFDTILIINACTNVACNSNVGVSIRFMSLSLSIIRVTL